MTGATVGKVAIIPSGKFLLNQRVGKLTITGKNVNHDYLRILLISSKFYSYCQATATGGAQGNISAEEILKFQIPLPTLQVQEQIVAELDGYAAQVDAAKKSIRTYEEKAQEAVAKLWGE